MQKRYSLVAAVLAASVTLFAQQPGGPRGRGPGPGERGPGGRGPGMWDDRPVTGAPYAAVRVSTSQQTLANGTVISRQEQTQLYRDGQGRMRTEITPERAGSQASGSRGPAVPRITITDPVAGVRRELDVPNKTSFETPMPRRGNPGPSRTPRANAPARANPPSDPNLKEESLGTQFMNGVNATGKRITRTIPAGTIGNSQSIQTVEERWVSEELKVPVMIKISDPRTGTRTEMLNVTSRSEPDPTLFQAPVGFAVKTRQPGPGGPGGGRRGPRPAAPPAQ